MKKILCIHQGYELYGSDRSFISSVKAIKDSFQSANLVVIIPRTGPIINELEKIGVEVEIKDMGILRKSELKKNPFKFIFKLIKYFFISISIIKKYDLVYINTMVVLDFILASVFVKRKGFIHVREIQTGFINLFFSIILKLSSFSLIYNSIPTEKALVFSKSNSLILENGVVDLGYEKNIISDKINILVLGRINGWKGQDFFLESFSKVSKIYRDKVKIKIVGDVFEDNIHFLEKLKDIILKNGLSSCVEILGFQKDTKLLYNWSNVVIIPSKKPEPFGRVAIEAMSVGRCLIAAKHGGLVNIIENDISGFLFEPNSTLDLNNKLEFIIDNIEIIQKMSLNARRRYENYYTETIYQNKLSMFIKK